MLRRMALISVLVMSVAWAAEAQQSEVPPDATGATGQRQGQAPAQAPGEEGVIDPRADEALRRMNNYLAGLRSFRVESTTVDEMVSTDGQKIQAVQESKITIVRPNRMKVERVGPNGRAMFIYDGSLFGLYNADKNVVAMAAAPPTIDAAIDEARERLQIDAPGGDLLVQNPYGALTEDLQVGRYIGLEPIAGVMAHHIAGTSKNVDWQLWIQDGPQPVPLRYVITSKDMPGQPQFTTSLRNWQTNVTVSDDTFKFAPPAGARHIEFAAPAKQGR